MDIVVAGDVAGDVADDVAGDVADDVVGDVVDDDDDFDVDVDAVDNYKNNHLSKDFGDHNYLNKDSDYNYIHN